ncbi:28S ribosomal protein S9, mitochondrial-like [Olea europaea var. sylvestris]|uniref:28S ribosomal S9, mitochondrial n=1 Tax=Olea europaea subsp. europaea TaxID=158383 RepID=A0A8S0QXS6_OLEEU|nr:28S ribosomal protein S9, mitochondrial-like [Olea europaea var. sylvestris]CAA2971074.1 28S ribosomal S9, mitochondrial [Olea europaea subsp. europaea]
MLSRFISKFSHLQRFRTLISSQAHILSPKPVSRNPSFPFFTFRLSSQTPNVSFFSTNRNGNGNFGDDSATSTSDLWKLNSEINQDIDSVFSVESGTLEGIHDQNAEEMKNGDDGIDGMFKGVEEKGGKSDIFRRVEEKIDGGGQVWTTAEENEPWSFAAEGKDGEDEDVFGVGEEKGEMGLSGFESVREVSVGSERRTEEKQLEVEEKALTAVLKGPNRAFGDLIAASGITDAMLDNLIALKDFEGIQGLPPLRDIEDQRYEKNTKKSSRAEIERQKQEEVANSRVRQVDDKGRAYGTGRRKCSIARVWIQPGEGNFVVNDKEFDVYFPMLDHRAALLRPFSETKTLGIWDVNCTVKGGGVSGQVGAIRLGISRALQNWEPGLRPPLRDAGFLTRDPRVVERKKPGKAKARKSFQWVKR